MTALASQGDLAVFLVELSSQVDKLSNSVGRFPHDGVDNGLVTKPLAGGDRVGRVAGDIIERVQYASNPALSPRAVRQFDFVLSHDDRLERRIDFHRCTQSGNASTDHQHIRKNMRYSLGRKSDEVPSAGLKRKFSHGKFRRIRAAKQRQVVKLPSTNLSLTRNRCEKNHDDLQTRHSRTCGNPASRGAPLEDQGPAAHHGVSVPLL